MKRLLCLILVLALMLPCVNMINVNAEGVSGSIEGAKLNIGKTLTLDYFAQLSGNTKDITMRFTAESGNTVLTEGAYDEETKAYKFTYPDVNPQCMTENIKAELLYKNEVIDVMERYSVKTYCTDIVSDGAEALELTDAKFRVLKRFMADMLVYGSSSQEYKGYKTESLADVPPWVGTNKGDFDVQNGIRSIIGNSNKDNRVMSVSLELSNVIRLCFKLKMYDDSTYVTLNGRKYQREELKNNNDGTYCLYTEDISATDFDKEYNVKVFFGENTVSDVAYNVNGYISEKSADENIGGIVKALYNYGISAEKYALALEDEIDDEFMSQPISEEINLIDSVNGDFESASALKDTKWTTMGNSVSLSIKSENGNKYLHTNKTPNLDNTNYHTPRLDISKFITQAGYYEISFRFKVIGEISKQPPFSCAIRTTGETSFSIAHGSNYYASLPSAGNATEGEWHTYTTSVCVQEDDFGKGGAWNFCMHMIHNAVSEIWIDDFSVVKKMFDTTEPVSVSSGETWVANEITLISEKRYKDSFKDVQVDVILTDGTTSFTIPAFWDGGYAWRARFTCPSEGKWTYTTVCSDESNEGLHGVTNTLTCTKYSGELEIYKRGFVKTEPNTKHFMYADGTPFFYLGDTHWSLGSEPLDMVQTIVDTRVSQGYTVFQSEPLGVSFDFVDGISENDIYGLKQFDGAFKIIADAGMVHTNAQFFFPSVMNGFILNYGGYSENSLGSISHRTGETVEIFDISDSAKTELERISRYWVARYSAYPVMWTLGQEVDDDYYWEAVEDGGGEAYRNHKEWNYVNNPYKYVAEYINKYDPYKSPLTGHQEGHTSTAASDSAFRDVEAHTWYAAQWKPAFKNYNSTAINTAKDYWNNGQGKPVVNYEGRYCYLWTKNFGARAQGWMSFLSGMFGHGYGAQDTWCYLSTYSESENTDDGVDIVTKEEKQSMTWKDALEFESGIQMGYMKNFFENTVGDWWNLIPRFDDTQYLTRESRSYAYIASNKDNTKIVTYYYNFSDTSLAQNVNSSAGGTRTGTYGKLLPNTKYNYKWFNPITGKFTGEGTFTSSSTGTWKAGTKATCDMVLYIYK